MTKKKKSSMIHVTLFNVCQGFACRSPWPRGLRRRSTAALVLRSWVRIPSGAWMSVCCKCCVLSGRGLCDALITCPEESYRLWRVVLCDLETLRMRRPWPVLGCCATEKKNVRHVENLCSSSACGFEWLERFSGGRTLWKVVNRLAIW